jgi:hypothetical protein
VTIHPQKLTASEAATYLRLAPSTLAKMRCFGGGPRFSKAGPRRVVYDKADLDEWLASRLYHSTAEYPANRNRAP